VPTRRPRAYARRPSRRPYTPPPAASSGTRTTDPALLVWLAPDATELPPHVHTADSERFRTLRGELTVVEEGGTNRLGPDEEHTVEPGREHYFRNDTDGFVAFHVELPWRKTLETQFTSFGLDHEGAFGGSDAYGEPGFVYGVVAGEYLREGTTVAVAPRPVQRLLWATVGRIARVAGYRAVDERCLRDGVWERTVEQPELSSSTTCRRRLRSRRSTSRPPRPSATDCRLRSPLAPVADRDASGAGLVLLARPAPARPAWAALEQPADGAGDRRVDGEQEHRQRREQERPEPGDERHDRADERERQPHAADDQQYHEPDRDRTPVSHTAGWTTGEHELASGVHRRRRAGSPRRSGEFATGATPRPTGRRVERERDVAAVGTVPIAVGA
jgi:mannose-6-phosphate isomerase-like protein (cupin superfamily)